MRDNPCKGKFGLKPRSAKPKLALHRYLTGAMPAPPVTLARNWSGKSWGMHNNDILGDCVWACAANVFETLRWLNGADMQIPDAAVQAGYKAYCGWSGDMADPGGGCDPSAVEQALLDTGLAGYRIDAFATVQDAQGNPPFAVDFNLIRNAINWFGCVQMSMNFPSNINQTPLFQQTGNVWDVPDSYEIIGGHEVLCNDYRVMPDGSVQFQVITWDTAQWVTERFCKAFIWLTLAPLSRLLLNAQNLSPAGLNWQQLVDDLQGNYGPNPGPDPQPGPAPSPIPPPYPWTHPVEWWSRLSLPAKVGVGLGAFVVVVLALYFGGVI